MIFTGKNLERVREGLTLAIQELKNEIATCPDVYTYADDITAAEDEITQYQKLIDRIDAKGAAS